MTTPPDLDRLRRESQCVGVAWFAGAPLQLISASGQPGDMAWPGWDAVAKVAPMLLREGPTASPEVLLQLPATLLLLAERATGVIAVAVALTPAGAGVALVQARMAAAQVSA